jgi:hypothetical protein
MLAFLITTVSKRLTLLAISFILLKNIEFLKMLGSYLLRDNILYCYISFSETNLSLLVSEHSFQIATQDANVQRQNGNPCVEQMGSHMHQLVLLAVKPPTGVERTL